jgi:hypothetical protein
VTRVFTATGAATNAYEAVSDDEHTLFASCGIKERGACLYYRCGVELTQTMIDTFESEDVIHAAGDVCKCPHYLFQINIDTDGVFVPPVRPPFL